MENETSVAKLSPGGFKAGITASRLYGERLVVCNLASTCQDGKGHWIKSHIGTHHSLARFNGWSNAEEVRDRVWI